MFLDMIPLYKMMPPNDKIVKKVRGIEDLFLYVDFESFRPILNKHSQASPKSNAGSAACDPVKMFKIIIIQAFYNLSDDEVVEQLNDRLSFMRFCGFSAGDASEAIPDALSIYNFKNSLGDDGTLELFNSFTQAMEKADLQFFEGNMVDAYFVESCKE